MSSDDKTVKFTGNIGSEPELRFTNGGKAVVGFSLAISDKWKDRDGEWQEESAWLRVTAWDELAENAVASLNKGDRVIVTGKLSIRTYTNRDDEEKTSVEIKADDIGVSLKRAQCVVERIARTNASSKGSSKGGKRPEPEPDYAPEPDASPSYGDEEPF